MKMRAAIAISTLVASCQTASPAPDAKPAGSRGAVDVVQAQLEAYNAQDVDKFVATYADDVVVMLRGKVWIEGKQALRERYGAMFAKYPKNRAKVAERRTEGDRVVVDHEIVTGRAPDRPDPWDVGWVRYEVDGGLIRRVELP
jgi:uncharacterized protein (TIGR02246 family)